MVRQRYVFVLVVIIVSLASCGSLSTTVPTAVNATVMPSLAVTPPTTLPTVTPVSSTTIADRSPTPIILTVDLPTPNSAASTTAMPVSATAPSGAPTEASSATPTPQPTPVNGGAPGGVIFFVDTDGVTIKTIHPDGTHDVVLLRQPGVKSVSGLSADPSGTYLLFNGDGVDYLVQRGQAKAVAPLVGQPRWSPDGKRFAATRVQDNANAWALFVYDTAAGAGQLLDVPGLQPDWFPDNQQLVYVNQANLWSYDLRTKATKQLTRLPTEQAAAWAVQTPHVLPDGQHIIFFGGIGNTLGASGNGQQWWSIPVGGGQPQRWTDLGTNIGGNGVVDYGVAPMGDALAWSEGAHASACESDESVTVSTTGLAGNTRLTKTVSELDAKRGPLLAALGLSWAPDSNHLALALQPYDCNSNAHPTPDPVTGRPVTGPPTIFVWNVRPDNTLGKFVLPTRLVNGSYPVWTR